MLVCHPSTGNSRLPRIVSAVRKGSDPGSDDFIPFRPKLSADLLVLIGADHRWHSRRVQVRAGQLHLSPAHGGPPPAQQSDLGTRIPLRRLSLQAGPSPNSLALVRGGAILLTLQTLEERQFDLWVKLIAIEIIRQTPLEDVKYIDVFSLTAKAPSTRRDEPGGSPTCHPAIRFDEWDAGRSRTSAHGSTVEALLKRCQSNDSYVPVKEKLVLFESLCRIGRGRSAEDVSRSRLPAAAIPKRARSLHDLTYCFASGGVREMCKYFETKCEDGGGGQTASPPHVRRLVHSDTSLHKVAFNRRFESVSHA